MSRRHRRRRRAAPAARGDRTWWGWLAIGLPLAAVGLLLLLSGGGEAPEASQQTGSRAPDFTLPTTLGTEVSLRDVLAEGDALLYFSMGVGCDGCFAQIPEVADLLTERGLTLVPIMVNPVDRVTAEAARFGVEGPILIDADRAVSRAYGMLGVYGHADRPSHSFALVTRDGTVRWVRHYATMFVPAEELLAAVPST